MRREKLPGDNVVSPKDACHSRTISLTSAAEALFVKATLATRSCNALGTLPRLEQKIGKRIQRREKPRTSRPARE